MMKFINVYCQQPKINWYFVLHSTKYHPIFVLSIIINAKTYFPTRLIKTGRLGRGKGQKTIT